MAQREKKGPARAGSGGERLLAWLDPVVRFIALWCGGALVACLMGLTVLDVFLRYVFNAPIFGAWDVSKLMLLMAFALSVAYSARTGGQVSVELLEGLVPPRVLRATEILVRVLGAIMLALLAWRLAAAGLTAAEYGEASAALTIPFGPFYFILAFGMALYTLVLVAEVGVLLGGNELHYRSDTP